MTNLNQPQPAATTELDDASLDLVVGAGIMIPDIVVHDIVVHEVVVHDTK